jgi:hypothetical protein
MTTMTKAMMEMIVLKLKTRASLIATGRDSQAQTRTKARWGRILSR